MPMDRSIYPEGWEAISLHIRTVRAGGRCECTGECGVDHSVKLIDGAASGQPRCLALNRRSHPVTGSPVILTVAHLDQIGGPCSCKKETGLKCGIDSHLKAMCARCHLRLDWPHHRANAAATRRARKNNMELFALA